VSELDAAQIMEIEILADTGVPPSYIADELDIPQEWIEAYLYGPEPE
jgi:hypothetical protein